MGQALTRERLDAYLQHLDDVTPEDLELALDRHLNDPQRGIYYPQIADIRGKVPAAGAALGADAAWSIAMQSYDETNSVVWTVTIEHARNLARPLWESGDLIGAKLAFRDAYNRVVAAGGERSEWKLSIGTDAAKRVEAVQQAVAAGLISQKRAQYFLPAPEPEPAMASVAGLLAGKVVPFPPKEQSKKNIEKLRQAFDEGMAAAERREAERKRYDEAMKRAAREQLEAARARAMAAAAEAQMNNLQDSRDGQKEREAAAKALMVIPDTEMKA